MGWSNSTFQLLIITASPAGFSGLFVYSPAPGAGRLVDSIAASAGTDPYGNAYLSGITSYGPTGSFSSMTAAGLEFQDTSSNLWNIQAIVAGMQSYIEFEAVTGHNSLFMHGTTGTLVAQHPGSFLVPETWQAMSPLAAGYTAGTVAPRYRLEPVGSAGVVRLAGAVSLTANHAAGNTFFTLPAAYVPSIVGQQNLPASSNNLSGFSFNNGYVIVSPGTGTLDMGSAGSTGNLFWLDGLTYSLD